MNYQSWLETVPHAFTNDSLWKMRAYKLALFLGDIGWYDVSKLNQDKRTQGVADQLYRALGSISANLSEGYSRNTGKDRARFYAYSLGSARESRDWYYKGRHVLGQQVIEHRLQFLSQIIQLLLVMIPQQRNSVDMFREENLIYSADRSGNKGADFSLQALNGLLKDVPLPE